MKRWAPLLLALVGCASEPAEDVTPPTVVRDTGSADTAVEPEFDAGPADDGVADVLAVDADSAPAPDTMPPADTGPETGPPDTGADTKPPVTWETTVPVKGPPHFDVAPDWFVDRAVLRLGETLGSARALPVSPLWTSWRAKLRLESQSLTCPKVVVRFSVRWGSPVGEFEDTVSIEVPKAAGILETPVAGKLSPPPVPATGATQPLVHFRVRQLGDPVKFGDCGRLDVWPSTVTLQAD